MLDKLRMAEWLGIAAVLFLVLWFTAPQQIPVFIYKANLVSFFAFLGYWLDRRLFPYARPGDLVIAESWNKTQLRRAIVVAAVILAGALAL